MGHHLNKESYDKYATKQKEVIELLEKRIKSNSKSQRESLDKEIKKLREQMEKYEKETIKLGN